MRPIRKIQKDWLASVGQVSCSEKSYKGCLLEPSRPLRVKSKITVWFVYNDHKFATIWDHIAELDSHKLLRIHALCEYE